MKNLFKTMMLVAVAAMGFTACSNNDVEEVLAPSKQTKKITVVSEITRTEFNSDLTKLVWSEGDTFAVFTDVETDLNIQSSAYDADATDFGLKVDEAATKVYAYYPYYAGNSSKTATEMSVGIPGTQTQSIAGQLTTGNLPMVAQGTIEGDKVALSFRPIATVLGFNIYHSEAELTENIVSIKFTASGEEKSSGYDYTYNLTNSEEAFTPGYQYTTLDLEGDAQFVPGTKKAEKPQAYMVVNKITYSVGVEIVVTTEGGTTYTFTSKENAIDCTETYRTMNLNLSKATKVVPGEVAIKEGDYVVMVNYGGSYYALSAEDASSNKRRAAIKISDYSSSDANYNTTNENIVWNISQTEGGFFLTNNSKYLYGTNEENYAQVGNTTDIIKINDNGDGSYQFISSNNTKDPRNLALNSGVNNGEFSFYKVSTTTGNSASSYADNIYLIPATYTAVPSINVDPKTITLTAEECEGTITVTTKNVTGNVTATLGEEYDWFDAEINEDGNLYYIASANEGEERTATVTLSAEGAKDVMITFTQKAASAGGGDTYQLLTDINNLKDGYTVIIAYTGGATAYAAGVQNGKYRNGTQITVSADKSEITDIKEACEFTVTINANGKFAFTDGTSGNLYYKGSKNELYTGTGSTNQDYWTVTVEANGVAKIVNVAETERYLQCNPSSGNRFACYKTSSNQKNPSIYYKAN